jgi:hypothetical protein
MEIRYQNTHADYEAFYEEIWRDSKAAGRERYYYALFWHLGILALGGLIAWKHDELWVICVFLTVAAYYVFGNWSYEKQWRKELKRTAQFFPGTSCILLVDNSGMTKRFSGVQMAVPWSEMVGYSVREDRLFVFYLQYQGFVIPLRQITSEASAELLNSLKEHKVAVKK